MPAHRKKEVALAAPDAAKRMIHRAASGARPNFTVTAARIRATWKRGKEYGVIIAWETESAGFGELTIVTGADGTTRVDTEAMGFEFITSVFQKLVEVAK